MPRTPTVCASDQTRFRRSRRASARRDSDGPDDRLQTVPRRSRRGVSRLARVVLTRASESDLALISYSYSSLSPSSAVRQREDGERDQTRATVCRRRSSAASDQTVPDAQTQTGVWGGLDGLIADRLVCFSAYAGRRDVRLTLVGGEKER